MGFTEPQPTMSLDGGLDMYNGMKRFNNGHSPKGRIVKFINDNGYDSDLEYAQKYFTEGQILEVKEIYVGRSSSTVEFVGLENLQFNTVHFVDIHF